jgi:16S rRNA (uracil1498-N3)-methyltransferase
VLDFPPSRPTENASDSLSIKLMTRRRWIADKSTADRAWLTGDHARHLVHVLRAQPGQEFDIVSDGRTRRGKVIAATADEVEFELGDEIATPKLPSVTLVLAVYKFDRMEWAIEKCTELGANSIVPVVAARTDTHLARSAEKRAERWRRLVRQAAEQSRRPSVPEVQLPVRLKDILAIAGFKVVLAETERETLLANALSQYSPSTKDQPLVLAIGPEGGWTEEELESFVDAGWLSASLGPTILRAETAAIAATAIAFSELEK